MFVKDKSHFLYMDLSFSWTVTKFQLDRSFSWTVVSIAVVSESVIGSSCVCVFVTFRTS